MKIKSDVIWAFLLIATAAISIYLGTKAGSLETEKNLKAAIEEKEKRIEILENKIEQLSEELTSRGIFSYPQASLITENGKAGIEVLISLNGRDQIKDLELKRIIYKELSFEIFSKEPKKNGRTVRIGDLNSHNPVTFELENFTEALGINLIFRSGQNQWHQFMVAKKTSGGEIKTFWVLTNQNFEVIDKHVDEGFPVDENGLLRLNSELSINYSAIRMNAQIGPEAIVQEVRTP